MLNVQIYSRRAKATLVAWFAVLDLGKTCQTKSGPGNEPETEFAIFQQGSQNLPRKKTRDSFWEGLSGLPA